MVNINFDTQWKTLQTVLWKYTNLAAKNIGENKSLFSVAYNYIFPMQSGEN